VFVCLQNLPHNLFLEISIFVKFSMVNSSLTYEILLYLNSYYFGMFALTEFGIAAFKVLHLPYPTGTFVSELLILVFLCCTESARIFMGRKGNLTEKTAPVLVSLALCVPSILGTIYFLIWQSYVLRLEVILCGIQLAMQGLELGFSVLCLSRFYRAGAY